MARLVALKNSNFYWPRGSEKFKFLWACVQWCNVLQAARRGGKRCSSPKKTHRKKSTSTFAKLLINSVVDFVCTKNSPTKELEEQPEQACQRGQDEDEPEHEDWDEPIHVAPRWVDIVGGPFNKEDELCVDLRRLQQRTKCTDATCEDFVKTFGKYLGLCDTFQFKRNKTDERLHNLAGATVLRLNGCPKCDRHVYLPDDKHQICPRCGHNRYDEKGKPLEVLLHG